MKVAFLATTKDVPSTHVQAVLDMGHDVLLETVEQKIEAEVLAGEIQLVIISIPDLTCSQYQFFKRLRKIPTLRVGVLSAAFDPRLASNVLSLGAVFFSQLPTSRSRLVVLIQKHLSYAKKNQIEKSAHFNSEAAEALAEVKTLGAVETNKTFWRRPETQEPAPFSPPVLPMGLTQQNARRHQARWATERVLGKVWNDSLLRELALLLSTYYEDARVAIIVHHRQSKDLRVLLDSHVTVDRELGSTISEVYSGAVLDTIRAGIKGALDQVTPVDGEMVIHPFYDSKDNTVFLLVWRPGQRIVAHEMMNELLKTFHLEYHLKNSMIGKIRLVQIYEQFYKVLKNKKQAA